MVFCDFVVCIYLIFGESLLQLIEVFQLQYALVFQLMSLILDPRRFLIKWVWFQQSGCGQTNVWPSFLNSSPPPEKNPVWNPVWYFHCIILILISAFGPGWGGENLFSRRLACFWSTTPLKENSQINQVQVYHTVCNTFWVCSNIEL